MHIFLKWASNIEQPSLAKAARFQGGSDQLFPIEVLCILY